MPIVFWKAQFERTAYIEKKGKTMLEKVSSCNVDNFLSSATRKMIDEHISGCNPNNSYNDSNIIILMKKKKSDITDKQT